ncbi:MAG: hypothetical protein R6X34_16690 [Chloroflexota bacterium]
MTENPELQPAPSIAPPATTPCPPSPQALAELVEYLYPEPGVVDILTLDQFIFRYKFSGLGAAAVADMERAQRITRTIGDHGQIGLAEFHIGLIYLHWQQPLAAAPYFNDALRHWQFNHHRLAVALAQFAQGAAHHHAYHYENALTHYGKTQQSLRKIEATGAAPHPLFRHRLHEILAACRENVVARIRHFGEDEPAAFRIPITQPVEPGDLPTAHIAPPPTGSGRTAVTPQPIINLHRAAANQTQVDVETTPVEPGPPQPEPPEPAYSPIPNHPNQGEHHVWYDIVERQDLEEFLPNIPAESFLLVDTRPELYTCQPGDLIIVEQEDTEGSIQVEPQNLTEQEQPRRRIYLGEVDYLPAFTIDSETNDVQFDPDTNEEIGKVKIGADQPDFPIFAEDIIGIVIGIWSKLNPERKTA